MDSWLFWPVLAAAGGAALSAWGYIRTILAQIAGLAVIRTEVSGSAAIAVIRYAQDTLKEYSLTQRAYSGYRDYIRPYRSYGIVGTSDLGQSGTGYRYGRIGFWLNEYSQGSHREAMGTEERYNNNIVITALRGTVDTRKLVVDAIDYLNQVNQASGAGRGYRVSTITGTASKTDHKVRESSGTRAVQSADTADRCPFRLLRWKPDDIGNQASTKPLLSTMAISPAQQNILDDVRQWLNARTWYEERGLPWRRGLLLYGPPGSGKSIMAQAIAEENGLRVFDFKLSTLTGEELVEEWEKIRSHTPCMVLLEDLNVVYDGDQLRDTGPPLEILLNCLSGIQRSNGVLIFATTNVRASLAPALTRKGRFDRDVEIGPLTREAKFELCKKVLLGFDSDWDTVVDSSPNDEVAAAFIERLTEFAMAKQPLN